MDAIFEGKVGDHAGLSDVFYVVDIAMLGDFLQHMVHEEVENAHDVLCADSKLRIQHSKLDFRWKTYQLNSLISNGCCNRCFIVKVVLQLLEFLLDQLHFDAPVLFLETT